MILRLTEHLEVPLRERNQLLLAGGYAPAYPVNELDAPQLSAVRLRDEILEAERMVRELNARLAKERNAYHDWMSSQPKLRKRTIS